MLCGLEIAMYLLPWIEYRNNSSKYSPQCRTSCVFSPERLNACTGQEWAPSQEIPREYSSFPHLKHCDQWSCMDRCRSQCRGRSWWSIRTIRCSTEPWRNLKQVRPIFNKEIKLFYSNLLDYNLFLKFCIRGIGYIKSIEVISLTDHWSEVAASSQ